MTAHLKPTPPEPVVLSLRERRRLVELPYRGASIQPHDGELVLPADRRRWVIDCARDAGLVAITEVGKKDPSRQPEAAELAEQALQDLECGAAWVIVEARESGHGIGIYDNAGALKDGSLEEIASLMGKSTDHPIWEAPQKDQQAVLVRLAPMSASATSRHGKRWRWRRCVRGCVTKRYRKFSNGSEPPANGTRPCRRLRTSGLSPS